MTENAHDRPDVPDGPATGHPAPPALHPAVSPRVLAAVAIALFALLVIWIAYHPPRIQLAAPFAAWVGAVPAILLGAVGCFALWAVLIGCGTGLVRARDPVEAASVGLVWLTGGSTLLLVFGRLTPATAWLLLVPCLRVSPASLLALIRPRSHLIGALLGLAALGFGALGMAPSAAYDDHVYHLSLRDGFAHSGSLWVVSPQPNVFRPFAHAALGAWCKVVFGERAAGLCNATWLLGAAALLASRGGLPGVIACAAWLSHPQWVRLAESHYAEPLLCLVFVLIALGGGGGATGIRHGLLLAMLPAIKYTGLYLAAFALPMLVHRDPPERFDRRSLGRLATGVVLGLCLLAVPGYVRNWLYTSNPVYPHANQLFNIQPNIDLDRINSQLPGTPSEFTAGPGVLLERFGMGRRPIDLLLAPWNVTMHGQFHDQQSQLRHFDGCISVLGLAAWLLVVLWLPIARSRATALLLFGVLAWGAWLGGSHQIRHLLPLVAVGAVLAGDAAAKLGPRIGNTLLLVALISTGWTGLDGLSRLDLTVEHLAGRISIEQHLDRRLPPNRAIRWCNHHLTASSTRLLVLLEERTAALKPPYLWTSLLPHWFIDLVVRCETLDRLDAFLDQHRFTHVLVPNYGLELYPEAVDEPALQDRIRQFFSERLDVLYQDRWATVFARHRRGSASDTGGLHRPPSPHPNHDEEPATN